MSAVIIGGAIMAVSSLKIFRAAIYLLFSLIGIAGLYFWLNYEFIAAVQIVVYVGGIVVLIIFSIFLTHGSGADMPGPKFSRSVFAALAAAAGFSLTLLMINQHDFFISSGKGVEPSVNNIGTQMLSTTEHGYLLPFEVISILLLAAMIGAIVIAIKTKPKT
ncbi:MAG TPA: NADH-quinone oxidoreductase subunit J [Bacteroidia bacterium]|nr:NADH-quinone oxidoreductase subunit J [Bacteroidia bacterium]